MTISFPVAGPEAFAGLYEKHLVPAIFRPWAELLVERAAPLQGERLIDVACGTGITARIAAERMGDMGHVVGVDVNPHMLGVARAVAPRIEWREGNAMSLPVRGEERFDVLTCHQGIQFFPDRPAALREMHRVLAQGGRIATGVWRSDEECEFLFGLRQIAERHVGPIKDNRHGFADPEALEELLEEAGFSHVMVEPVRMTLRFADGESFVRLNAMALVSMSARGKAMSDGERAEVFGAIVRDSLPVLERCRTSDGAHEWELSSNIATASV